MFDDEQQIRERFDSGDIVGGTRLAVRAKIAELKKQQDENLTVAFQQFIDRHPEFEEGPGWQYYSRLMRAWLVENGITPAMATLENLEAAWHGSCVGKRIPATAPSRPAAQPQPAQPAVSTLVSGQADAEVDREARAAIAGGRISRESIDSMSNIEFERLARSVVFERAVEILFPRREMVRRSRGELIAAAAQASPIAGEGISPAAAIRLAEIKKADEWVAAYRAERAQPPKPARSNVFRPQDGSPLPKLATESLLRSQIAQEKADQQFLEEAERKAVRRRRVLAHKGGK